MVATELVSRGKYHLVGSRALTFATCILGAEIVANVFRWTLVNFLTVFLEPLLEDGLWIALLGSFAWSIVHLIRARKRGPRLMLPPVTVNVLTLLMVLYVPFDYITTQFDFHMNYSARMAVVREVAAGKLDGRIRVSGGRGDFIGLQPWQSYLSTGGEIMRWRRPNAQLIFFFDFRGVLSSFAGFVYSTDGTPPRQDDFGGNFVEIEHLRDNWFYASSRN
ncbi:MAG: hypothetical protein LAO19_17775 [Acidobacteriia bacterium]|nr:hypothetical protein [Terriglobia bacterium]